LEKAAMDSIQDDRKAEYHRKYAAECVTMALSSVQDDDKALWLTLAQSWVRLAEQVACVESNPKRRRKRLRMKLIELRSGASQPDEDQHYPVRTLRALPAPT
jgi:hypothetical protein